MHALNDKSSLHFLTEFRLSGSFLCFLELVFVVVQLDGSVTDFVANALATKGASAALV